MLLRTGAPRYADLIERSLYNAVLPGISLDGSAYFYVNALQVRSGQADDDPRNPANGRAGWFDVACCPPNIMRTLASLGSLLATSDDDGIQIHQYAASAITAELPSGEAELAVATDYPWDGRIKISVQASPARDWTVALRIPAWCTDAKVLIAGAAAAEAGKPGTYLRLRRRWTAGDCVLLDLPMPVRQTIAHKRVDAVRDCAAVERGPLVYCLEQADHPAGVLVDDIQMMNGDRTAAWSPDLLGGVTAVQLTGQTTPGAVPLYQPRTADDGQPGRLAQLSAIPYFAWANRGPGPMRVWIPLGRPG